MVTVRDLIVLSASVENGLIGPQSALIPTLKCLPLSRRHLDRVHSATHSRLPLKHALAQALAL